VGYLLVDFLASGEGQKFIGAERGGKEGPGAGAAELHHPGKEPVRPARGSHTSLVVDTELQLAVGQQAALAADRQGDRDLALAGDPHGMGQTGGQEFVGKDLTGGPAVHALQFASA
jgi:hypothetical protein